MVQVGVRDEIVLYRAAQDATDRRGQGSIVDCLADAGIECTGIETDIVAGSRSRDHVGGEVAFVKTAANAEWDDGESRMLSGGSDRTDQQKEE